MICNLAYVVKVGKGYLVLRTLSHKNGELQLFLMRSYHGEALLERFSSPNAEEGEGD